MDGDLDFILPMPPGVNNQQAQGASMSSMKMMDWVIIPRMPRNMASPSDTRPGQLISAM
jgi:hypothetical protein